MSREEKLAEFVAWAQHHTTGDEKGQAQSSWTACSRLLATRASSHLRRGGRGQALKLVLARLFVERQPEGFDRSDQVGARLLRRGLEHVSVSPKSVGLLDITLLG
jgi:hypothetical protein